MSIMSNLEKMCHILVDHSVVEGQTPPMPKPTSAQCETTRSWSITPAVCVSYINVFCTIPGKQTPMDQFICLDSYPPGTCSYWWICGLKCPALIVMAQIPEDLATWQILIYCLGQGLKCYKYCKVLHCLSLGTNGLVIIERAVWLKLRFHHWVS